MRLSRFVRDKRRVVFVVISTTFFVICVINHFTCKLQQGEDANLKEPMKWDQNKVFRLFNQMGKFGSTPSMLHYVLSRERDENFKNSVLQSLNLLVGIQPERPRSLEVWYKNLTPEVTLAIVSCGCRNDEAMTMIKSAVMMSQEIKLNVIAFLDENSAPKFAQSILELKWIMNSIGLDFSFELRKIWFPAYKNKQWKTMWQPCAAQRLFFPKLLPTVDSILFVDSDILFVSSVWDYWAHFQRMDAHQFTSVVANDELPGNGWYNLHTKVPAFGPRGLNAGVMLMNLTRMRHFDFVKKVVQIYEEYEDRIFLADQDILNILYNGNPKLVLELPCRYNFRATHCDCEHDSFAREDCKCAAAMTQGVSLIHGNLGAFHSDQYPFMRIIYEAFRNWDVTQTTCSIFLRNLRKELDVELTEANPCFGLSSDMILKQMETYCVNIRFKEKRKNLD